MDETRWTVAPSQLRGDAADEQGRWRRPPPTVGWVCTSFFKGRVRRRRRQKPWNIWAYGQWSRSTSPSSTSVPCRKAWFPCHWKVSGGEMISHAKIHSHCRRSKVWGCWMRPSLLIALWPFEVSFEKLLGLSFCICVLGDKTNIWMATYNNKFQKTHVG